MKQKGREKEFVIRLPLDKALTYFVRAEAIDRNMEEADYLRLLIQQEMDKEPTVFTSTTRLPGPEK
jgi:hypothetical protein